MISIIAKTSKLTSLQARSLSVTTDTRVIFHRSRCDCYARLETNTGALALVLCVYVANINYCFLKVVLSFETNILGRVTLPVQARLHI